MSQIPNIEGPIDPRKAGAAQNDSAVDPEKFKRLLKVEESDETQKRHKRQKPKKQEEEEELEKPVEKAVIPQTSFASLLAKPKPPKDSIFSQTAKAKVVTTTPETLSAFTLLSSKKEASTQTPKLHLDKTQLHTPPPAKKIPEKPPTERASPPIKGEEAPIKQKTPEAHIPQAIPKKPTQQGEAPITQAPLPITTPATQETSTTLSTKASPKLSPPSQEPEETSPFPPPQKQAPIETEKPSSTLSKEMPPLLKEKEKEHTPALSSPISETPPQMPISPPLLSTEPIETEKPTSTLPTEMPPLLKEKEKEHTPALSSPISETPPQMPISPPLLSTEPPAYTSLSPEVFDLFEKLIGFMMIEEYKGISITTIKLSMPNSPFHDCEIKLEHYDTAPNAFNVQLLGNPKALDLFNANFQTLQAAFQQSQLSFQINLQPPLLLESYRHLIRRKESAQDQNHPQDNPQ